MNELAPTMALLLKRVKGRMSQLRNYSVFGICARFSAELGGATDFTEQKEEEAHNLLTVAMTRWPEYSGDSSYPVPHPEASPCVAFNHACQDEMWSPDHPYGAARLRLLDWLIDYFEEASI